MPSKEMTRARKFSRALAIVPQMRTFWRGYAKWRFRARWPAPGETPCETPSEAPDEKNVAPGLSNPLQSYFDSHKEGPGIWKWNHYFEIYDRHFSRFRNREVRVLEIGIYSGGSLQMWRDYFGPRCRVYGIDIEPACKAYESDSVKVFIGDQKDRKFWKRFKQEVPAIDIVIDDGGHRPEQQIVTFEELLPYLQPGGVYLCEDVHRTLNTFATYLYGFAHNLNANDRSEENLDNNERRLVFGTTPLQSAVHSIHFYPYVTVVERRNTPLSEFVAPKHGTQWQPFLK
jgi:hypothetical protein